MKGKSRCGQAAVEYLIALVALLAVTGVMAYLLRAERRASVRTVQLVAGDSP